MSARELVLAEGIYASKSTDAAWAAVRHGNAGWRLLQDGGWEGLLCYKPRGTKECLWLPTTEFLRQKRMKKRQNVMYYESHPLELKRLVREKRSPQIFVHTLYPTKISDKE